MRSETKSQGQGNKRETPLPGFLGMYGGSGDDEHAVDLSAKSFVGGVRNPHRRKGSRPIAARQFDGVAPIGFHSIARFHRYESRRDHFAAHAQSGELPIQHIPRGSGFVADPQLLDRTELVHQLPNRLRAVSNYTEGSDFTAGFSNGYCDGVRMDVLPISRLGYFVPRLQRCLPLGVLAIGFLNRLRGNNPHRLIFTTYKLIVNKNLYGL